MLTHLLFGAGYALAAAAQPGPLQAFLLSRVAANGWRRTLPACLAPVVSDGPIALLTLFVLGQLSVGVQHLLQAAGGLLLLYFAWQTFRQWHDAESVARESAPRTLFEAVVVNLLNPNPYLGWALVLGPAVLTAWQEHAGHALGLVAAFYGTMVMALAGFILLVGTASHLGPRVQRSLVGLSAGVLAVLGVYLLTVAVLELRPA